MSGSAKSSVVRTNLTKSLIKVWKTGAALEVHSDGKAIALLTMDEPKGIPPLRIRLKDARENWSDLLVQVSQSRARYFFLVRFTGLKVDEPTPVIYLVPTEHRNFFHDEWVAHKRAHRASLPAPSSFQEQIDELREGVGEDLQSALNEMDAQMKLGFQKIEQKIAIAFAGIVRPNGDLYATPEFGVVPLRTIQDMVPDVDRAK